VANVILARLTPYENEVIGHDQCGFRRNTSITDQIFPTPQTLKKEMGIQPGNTPLSCGLLKPAIESFNKVQGIS
jgi:hypothetical protein